MSVSQIPAAIMLPRRELEMDPPGLNEMAGLEMAICVEINLGSTCECCYRTTHIEVHISENDVES